MSLLSISSIFRVVESYWPETLAQGTVETKLSHVRSTFCSNDISYLALKPAGGGISIFLQAAKNLVADFSSRWIRQRPDHALI